MSQLVVLAQDFDRFINDQLQKIPYKPSEEVADMIGKITALVATGYAVYRKPKKMCIGGSIGFTVSTRDFFDHPFIAKAV